ncbi:MAG TPA: Calx-beta domain-containing protein, partial [Vicinamibacterales bacterium]|nr:Calx-beta domain-containing protein [Vicinamibacterales bacterium]
VLLNGGASSDVDGQPLTYQWTFTVRPPDSAATLTGASSAGASFIADRTGTYVVQLIVNDGLVGSAPDTVTVSTTNTTPVANAGADRLDVVVGTAVTLNGFASSDADGQSLSFSWSLIARPLGSTATLADATTASPAFTPDVPGDYVAQLIVNDGFVDSTPDTVLIQTVAVERPIVTIQAVDAVASEVGTDPATFIVTRTGATSLPLTVSFTRTGTATAGLDYADFPLSVTIPSGQAGTLITIAPLGDGLSEGPESVILTVAADAAYTIGTAASATVIITDEQSAAIVATDPSATEGGDTATFTVSRAIATASPRDVTVRIVGGTATLGTDYNFLNNPSIVANGPSDFVVRIPAGQTSATFAMTAVLDLVLEGTETVILTAEAASATATIVDFVPPLVSITATDALAYEAGQDRAVFTIARTGPVAAPLDVSAFVTGGTATLGTDYNFFDNTSIVQNLPTGFVVRIPAGQATVTVAMTPVPDGIVESPETVALSVINGTNYVAGVPSTAIATIEEVAIGATLIDFEDFPDSMPITPLPSTYRGITWTNWAMYAPVNSGLYMVRGVNAPYALVDGARFSFSPRVFLGAWFGRCSHCVGGAVYFELYRSGALVATSALLPDSTSQGSAPGMTFLSSNYAGLVDEVRVRSLGASMTPAGSAWVMDDLMFGPTDPNQPTVTLTATDNAASDVSLDAGAFTITRTGDTSLPLTVNLLRSGTATAGTDYQALPSFVTLAPGQASATIAVVPIADSSVEGAEAVTFTLAPSASYSGSASTSDTVYIVDSGLPPSVLIDFEDQPDSIPGPPAQSFPSNYRGITWNNWQHYAPAPPQVVAHGVNFIYAKVDGASFTFLGRVFLGASFSRTMGYPGNIYFELYLDGALVATSPVLADVPPQLTFLPSGYSGFVDEVRVRSLGSTIVAGSGSAWLMDDVLFGAVDTSRPSVSIAATDAAASEAQADTGTVTITRAGDLTAPLVVNLSLAGTAVAGADYTPILSQVTIPAGQSATTVVITPLADQLFELPETVTLTIAPSPAYYRTAAVATVTISDDQSAIALIIDFEDQPDSIPGPPAQTFPSSYQGVTWNNWQHYAPYGAQVQAHGVNAIYAKVDGASFTFSERPFFGASFSRIAGFPGNVYFELYLDGVLVATSPVLVDVPPQLTFLMSGYTGPVDEVRVRSLGNTIISGSGSTWIIDDLWFGAADTSRPVVSIAATDSVASEGPLNTGAFTITRTGDLLAPLVVNLTRSGTAVEGADYAPLTLPVTIPAGQAMTTVTIMPVADGVIEGSETVTLTLAASPNYFGGTTTATVTIADDQTIVGTIIDFEDQPNSIPIGTSFPTSYQGITWVNWQHYAPYPAPYQQHGANSIFPRGDGASFLFPERPFLGAWFSRDPTRPGDVYFEMYRSGVLVATSPSLPNPPTSVVTFLSSGYSGLVDEVRVRCLGGACIPTSSFWVMDDVTFGVSPLQQACVAPPLGIVSLWTADGSAADAFGLNQPSATQVSYVAGKVGQGFTFGANGFLDIPASTSLANQRFTVSAWVRPDGAGPNNDIYGNAIISAPVTGTNVPIGVGWRATDGRFLFAFGDINTEIIVSEHSFAAGQFRYVTVAYDGTTFTLFVDGVLEASRVLTKTVQAAVSWNIGSTNAVFRGGGVPRTWNGVIDEVSVFNRALSQSEIQSLAQAGGGLCRP